MTLVSKWFPKFVEVISLPAELFLCCYYHRTPEKLHTWIKAVVDAYHSSQEGTLIREARDLMNPKIVKKLEELKILVEDNFM